MKNLTTALVAGAATAGALALGVSSLTGASAGAAPQTSAAATTGFSMVRSLGATTAGCLPQVRSFVKITPGENAETMAITATGLPASTDFDLFVLQNPSAPFGLAWYQGDLHSDASGTAQGNFVGRFNQETFTVAPGVGSAPVIHRSPIADAASNPITPPVHQFHLGIWFNSPADAAAAGCGSAVTAFNGEHNAGGQILSTRQFPVNAGPLGRIVP